MPLMGSSSAPVRNLPEPMEVPMLRKSFGVLPVSSRASTYTGARQPADRSRGVQGAAGRLYCMTTEALMCPNLLES